MGIGDDKVLVETLDAPTTEMLVSTVEKENNGETKPHVVENDKEEDDEEVASYIEEEINSEYMVVEEVVEEEEEEDEDARLTALYEREKAAEAARLEAAAAAEKDGRTTPLTTNVSSSKDESTTEEMVVDEGEEDYTDVEIVDDEDEYTDEEIVEDYEQKTTEETKNEVQDEIIEDVVAPKEDEQMQNVASSTEEVKQVVKAPQSKPPMAPKVLKEIEKDEPQAPPSSTKSNSGGMTFANAFSAPDPAGKPPETPVSNNDPPGQSAEKKDLSPKLFNDSGTPVTAPMSEKSDKSDSGSYVDGTESSHSAASAAKNKKVTALMNAYLDNTARSPNPPTFSPGSTGKRIEFSPASPATKRSISLPVFDRTNPEVMVTPGGSVHSLREKFEKSSRNSVNRFEFGESFRQSQKMKLQTEKKKESEAQSLYRGFDLLQYEQGKAQMGEVDDSNINRTFVFAGTNEDVSLNDGTIKVDYRSKTYYGFIFLVHRTRGLMLLHYPETPDSPAHYRLPGGLVTEEDFLDAANSSGNGKIQLQIAARSGAAKALYNDTGMDVRSHLARLKPAILFLNPPKDKHGVRLLKNEHEDQLFYFLQVAEEDFLADAGSKLQGPMGESSNSIKLRLAKEIDGFTFAKEPADAAAMLQDHSDGHASQALRMVMKQASGSKNSSPTKSTSFRVDKSGTVLEQSPTASNDNDDPVSSSAALYEDNQSSHAPIKRDSKKPAGEYNPTSLEVGTDRPDGESIPKPAGMEHSKAATPRSKQRGGAGSPKTMEEEEREAKAAAAAKKAAAEAEAQQQASCCCGFGFW